MARVTSVSTLVSTTEINDENTNGKQDETALISDENTANGIGDNNDNVINLDPYSNHMTLKVWLDNINMGQYYNIFEKNGFSEEINTLTDVTDNDLEKMGIHKIAHRKKILREIVILSGEQNQNNIISKHPGYDDASDEEMLYVNHDYEKQQMVQTTDTTTGGNDNDNDNDSTDDNDGDNLYEKGTTTNGN
eukprot:522973_1